MSCFSPVHITFMKNAQHYWTPLPLRSASQGTLPTSQPKSVLIKAKAADLLTLLLASLKIKSYQLIITMPKMASSHHITHQSFLCSKIVKWAPPLAASLTSCVRQFSSKHSRKLLNSFLSAVLYFQQISHKFYSTMVRLLPAVYRIFNLFLHYGWVVYKSLPPGYPS